MGLIASSLAYGRVKQILKSVEIVLNVMGSPHKYLVNSDPRIIKRDLKGFKHRFTSGDELSTLLIGVRSVLKKYGSLEHCFMDAFDETNETVLPALTEFVQKLGGPIEGLLPSPSGKSACKRLNLYMRWMIRKDQVDPGCWSKVSPSKLVIPLDTHMHKMGLEFGFTRRKQADIRTVLEITSMFRSIMPRDPVRYDFVLTRLGIRNDMSHETFKW